jgi:hypothetical protein
MKKKLPTLADLKGYKWDTSKFIKLKTSVTRCPTCGFFRLKSKGGSE